MSISKLRTFAITVIGSAAILGGSGSASARDGTAQSLLADLRSSGASFTYVRAGRHDGGMRGHHAGRHRSFGGQRFGHTGRGYGRHRGYGYRRGGYGRGGAALGGLAAGAIIGGALAAQAAQGGVGDGPSRAEVASCSRRFKSYDASSGTYLGYDGQRHACP